MSKTFKLCPTFFQEGGIFLGGIRPPAPPRVTSLITITLKVITITIAITFVLKHSQKENKNPFARFHVSRPIFWDNIRKEWMKWTKLPICNDLQCTDDDNRSYRNVCNMSLISFSLSVRIKHRKKKSHQLLTEMFVQTTNQLRNRNLRQGET